MSPHFVLETHVAYAEYRKVFGLPAVNPVRTLLVAFASTWLATVAGVAVGFPARYIARTPATCGAAKEVPSTAALQTSLPLQADVMMAPGAKTSTQLP